jgi:uncharacterized protein YndB with AHSA1/START domain
MPNTTAGPTSAVHTSFAVERAYAAAPARVFAAWADAATKRRWYAEGDRGWQVLDFTHDFRVGGCDVLHGRMPDGKEIRNESVYQDIVPDRRIILASSMSFGGQRIAVSLGTVEITPDGEGSKLTYTDHNVLLDGADAYLAEGPVGALKTGWKTLLERLDKELRAVAR